MERNYREKLAFGSVNGRLGKPKSGPELSGRRAGSLGSGLSRRIARVTDTARRSDCSQQARWPAQVFVAWIGGVIARFFALASRHVMKLTAATMIPPPVIT